MSFTYATMYLCHNASLSIQIRNSVSSHVSCTITITRVKFLRKPCNPLIFANTLAFEGRAFQLLVALRRENRRYSLTQQDFHCAGIFLIILTGRLEHAAKKDYFVGDRTPNLLAIKFIIGFRKMILQEKW